MHTVCSADPLADLPPGAATALQRALLEPDPGEQVDLGGALERCDAVLELVERWQDAFFTSLPEEVDLEEEARYAAEAGLSLDEVESGYSEDDAGDDEGEYEGDDEDGYDGSGVVLEPGGTDEAALDPDLRLHLPEDLVTVLERELLLLPLRVRLEALVAAGILVGEWSDLIADPEKLLGHLVLAHAEPQVRTDHEELVRRHGALHGDAGPAHLAGPS